MIRSCQILVLEFLTSDNYFHMPCRTPSKENTFQLYTFILYQLSNICTPVNWVDWIQTISFELMMKIDFVWAINIKKINTILSPLRVLMNVYTFNCILNHMNSLYKIRNQTTLKPNTTAMNQPFLSMQIKLLWTTKSQPALHFQEHGGSSAYSHGHI